MPFPSAPLKLSNQQYAASSAVTPQPWPPPSLTATKVISRGVGTRTGAVDWMLVPLLKTRESEKSSSQPQHANAPVSVSAHVRVAGADR